MVGWGVVGLGGAAAGARDARARARPAACWRSSAGSPASLFGAVMDVYQWTLAAEHTLASYLAISGTSLPFNIAHAVGQCVLRLAARAGVHPRARALPPPLRGALAARRTRARRAIAARADRALLAVPRAARRRPPADVAPAIARAVHYLRFSPERRRRLRRGAPPVARPRCTPAGPRSASPRPGATRATWTSAATPPWTTSPPTRARLTDVGEIERTLLVLRAAG